MKILGWNCRGQGRPEFAPKFKILSNLLKVDVFCVMEPKSSFNKVAKSVFCKYFSNVFAADRVGKADGLCLF